MDGNLPELLAGALVPAGTEDASAVGARRFAAAFLSAVRGSGGRLDGKEAGRLLAPRRGALEGPGSSVGDAGDGKGDFGRAEEWPKGLVRFAWGSAEDRAAWIEDAKARFPDLEGLDALATEDPLESACRLAVLCQAAGRLRAGAPWRAPPVPWPSGPRRGKDRIGGKGPFEGKGPGPTP